MDIPEYLEIKDQQQFERWMKLAKFISSHNSDYLTRDEREMMILDLYQLERGYSEEAEDYTKARKIYSPFLKQVSQKLSNLVLIKNKDYNWEKVPSGFTNRRPGEDFTDIVAHDLLLSEKTIELYQQLKRKSIDINKKFDTSLEKTAFKLARILEDKDYENYTGV